MRLVLKTAENCIFQRKIFIGGDIFANRSEFVGSGRGYRRGRYRVVGRGGELISSQPREGFYLPYDDYRVYRH